MKLLSAALIAFTTVVISCNHADTEELEDSVIGREEWMKMRLADPIPAATRQTNVAPFKTACKNGKELTALFSLIPKPSFHSAGSTIKRTTAKGMITLNA